MRFPFSLTSSLTAYLVKQKIAGRCRFPLVLMLEPLHACNLSCAGCGRIREYADTLHARLSVDQCMAAAEECGAPVVSICGGEPLLYQHLGELVQRLVARRRHIYLCTNGVLLSRRLCELKSTTRLFINVHLDGMEATHDRMVDCPGVFAAAVRGIKDAVAAGFQVTTNTTVYRQTDVHEMIVLWEYLAELGVGGFMISPAFSYEAVEDSAVDDGRIFMTRQEVHEKFSQLRPLARRFRVTASPVYMDFLCGRRELTCAAWANPTYNVRGWRGPCYLVGDVHHASYRELVEKTDWDGIGPGRDPRCAHCAVHCGFEPAAVMAANRHLGDMLKMAVWQMG